MLDLLLMGGAARRRAPRPRPRSPARFAGGADTDSRGGSSEVVRLARRCYSYDEMEEFLDVAMGLVLDFVSEEYSPQLLLVELRYVPEGETGESGCMERAGVRAEYSEFSYEYCPADNTIYIGQKMLWS